MNYDFFLCSGLRRKDAFERNVRILEILNSHGFVTFAPQIEMPLNTSLSAHDIFLKNTKAIDLSDNILFIPDGAGEGVFFEIGYAFNRGKNIIGFTNNDLSHFGKIFQGFWETIEKRANSFDELKTILKKLKS